MTINPQQLYGVDGSPEGVLKAPINTLVRDLSSPKIYRKTTNEVLDTGWEEFGGIGEAESLTVKVVVANQMARYALTTAQVQNGDYVYQTDTATLYEVIDQTTLSGSTGYVALATVTSAQISDASANGRSLITAADYAAMRTLLAALQIPTGITVGASGEGGGMLVSAAVNLGVLYFQNTNVDGYPAIGFVDSDGNEHGAVGIGNSGGSAISQNVTFVESSDLRTTAGTPRDGFKIFQTSLRSDHNYQATRIEYGANLGDIVLHSYKPSTFEHATATLSSVGLILSGDVAGYNTNRLIGISENSAIVFSGITAGTGHDRTEYWSYGDTLANSGGHVFSTGGVQGSQTPKLIIANDFTKFVTTPVIIGTYVQYGSSSGPLDYAGLGSPEGAVGAPIGSTYRRTDGGAGTSFYVKESGVSNTGWVGK